jgi:ATP-dependent helicase/nuclease subunit A
LGGRPTETESCDHPWWITVSSAPEAVAATGGEWTEERKLPEGALEALREGLSFRYTHSAATMAPSKQTATGRKDRFRDREAAEEAQERVMIHRGWRKPSFRDRRLDGVEFGTAIHSVMQYIPYEQCGTVTAVQTELDRLVEEKRLTKEQIDAVDPNRIVKLFSTELGQKLMYGKVLREFKFSILDDGTNYGSGLEGERVLLQGVVDCALLEEDGITIVDYKTDQVTEDTVEELILRYRPQVSAYADAMSRIYEQPIKGVYLYLFQLDRFVKV